MTAEPPASPSPSEAEVSVEDQQQPMAEAQVEQPAAEAAAAESETTAEAPEAAAETGDRAASLEAELTALRQEHETVRSQYMRIAADFDNFRKRQQRDAEDLKLQLTCSTLGEILPVVDNFERARQQLNPEGEEAQALHRSYQGLYKQLVDVLKQLGVSPMRVEGEPFDPTLHEAVLREPSDAHCEDVVMEELQRGYHLDGRVLRHAMVKVSMGPGPAAAPESARLRATDGGLLPAAGC